MVVRAATAGRAEIQQALSAARALSAAEAAPEVQRMAEEQRAQMLA
jgi:hypothetical protein